MAAMIEAMPAAPGVIAARQAGGGFGGCMVALVEQADVDAFARCGEGRLRLGRPGSTRTSTRSGRGGRRHAWNYELSRATPMVAPYRVSLSW